MSIGDNYKRISEEIRSIARSLGRTDEIQIIAVSKNFPVETLQNAIDSGIPMLGENRIQEAKAKLPDLTGTFSAHLVGHLQSNKARDAIKLFDVIHSIDKMSTAKKVDAEAAAIGKRQKILIQVNASGEESKYGIEPKKARELVKEITDLNNIELLGLMTIAPFTDNEELVRRAFKETRDLMLEINVQEGLRLRELSMGMSSDYVLAVKEGSTMVRIGTAIFGERTYT